VKDTVNSNTVALMQMINGVTTAVSNDGEKTRALITQQYEQNLSRQLTDANAAIIELRSQLHGSSAARTAEINVTQTVNQMQQQQQQQQLNERISALVAEHQNIRQGIINLGTMSGSAGQQTAANTRVN
jgi:small-conductance mechanosensitive channel